MLVPCYQTQKVRDFKVRISSLLSQTNYIPRPVAQVGEMVQQVRNYAIGGCQPRGENSLSRGGKDSRRHTEKGIELVFDLVCIYFFPYLT